MTALVLSLPRNDAALPARALGLTPALLVVGVLLVVPMLTLLRYSFNQFTCSS